MNETAQLPAIEEKSGDSRPLLASSRAPIFLGALACLAMLALHAYPLIRPWLFDDDFTLLTDCWTWESTKEILWVPFNENAMPPMPLARLFDFVLVRLAGPVTNLPGVAGLQGPLAMLAAMWLVYLFVRREMGHSFYGLVAMILFGVSLKYFEAVSWFAGSFITVTLVFILLSLLAGQSWRLTSRPSRLAWCVFFTALAPFWFASGVLAGPLCCLYLLPQDDDRPRSLHRWLPSLIPLFGSALFLLVALVMKQVPLPDANSPPFLEVFNPFVGLVYSGRSMVDNLVLGVLSGAGRVCPLELAPFALAAIFLAGAWWWKRAPRRRLLLLGFGFILLSYWLTYSGRAAFPYEGPLHQWNRYQLLPFLGLVLFVCGGLPSRQGTLFQLDSSGRLTRAQFLALSLLTAVLFILQFPIGLIGHIRTDPDAEAQMAVLQHIVEVDARCREYRISAETARQTLPFLEIPYSTTPGAGYPPRINGWQWLRGSRHPRPYDNFDEVRRLLEVESVHKSY
jgi:hypothetical protein